jgi:hypothetical protein
VGELTGVPEVDAATDSGARESGVHDGGREATVDVVESAAAEGCSASSIDPQKIASVVRDCVLEFGCNPSLPTLTLSQCITGDYPAAVPAAYGCGVGASGCGAVEQCTGFDFPTTSDCPSAGEYCNGNRAAHCTGPERGVVEDCAVTGGNCTTYANEGGSYVGCEVVTYCTDTDGKTHCCPGFGCVSSVYTCYGHVAIGTGCSAQEPCGILDGSAGCHPTLPLCVAPGSSCSGSDLLVCGEDERQLTLPCGSAGLSCTVSDGLPQCLAPGCSAADVDACQESCTGSIANLCVGGARVQANCKSYGFSACQVYAGSAPLPGSYVECVP